MSATNDNSKPKREDQRIHIDTRLDPRFDDDILQYVWELKRKPARGEHKRHSYVETFREAFKLIRELRDHKTHLLYAMFPWLLEELPNQAQLNNVLNPLMRRLMEDPFIEGDTDYPYSNSIE